MHDFLLFAGAFLASAVEMVEALTIVLAVGITRGWRSAALGRGGRAALRSCSSSASSDPRSPRSPSTRSASSSGTVLLIFGLQWLRKAILRAGGLKALHDEDAIFRAEVATLEQRRRIVIARLVLVHRVVQRRVPRRARGRVHRRDLRRHAGKRRPRRDRRGRRARRGARSPASWLTHRSHKSPRTR